MWHSKGYHKPRKPLATRTALKPPTKPMRHEAAKTRQKRVETTAAWFEANPPDANGNWHCYISKHPQCPKLLTRETINLEHDISKARDPKRKYDITNLYPACSFDNKAKGSMSAKEYMAL